MTRAAASTNLATSKWVALALMFFLSLHVLTFRGYNGDQGLRAYWVTQSIVHDGRLDIGERVTSPGERVTSPDGRQYSMYGIALSLAMLPFYLVGQLAASAFPAVPRDYVTLFTVALTNPFVTALTCVILLMYIVELEYRRRTAFALALLYGFGTMAWNYSQYGFSEPLLTLFFLFALLCLHRACRPASLSVGCVFLAGLFTALGLLTEVYSAMFIAVAISLYLLAQLWLRRPSPGRAIGTALAFGVPFVLAIAFLAYYAMLRWGHFPGGRIGLERLSLWHTPVGVYGFLLSPGKSFFLYASPVILSFWGWRAFARKHRAETLIFSGIALASVFLSASLVDFWHGDAAWGPRYIFHLVPLALLPAAETIEAGRLQRFWPRIGAIALCTISFLIQLGGVLVNLGRYLRMLEAYNLGDPRYIPWLSPIVGHWVLVISTLYKLWTGQSLEILYWSGWENWPRHLADMTGYDGFDLWFINLHTLSPGTINAWITVGGVLALASIAVVCGRLLYRMVRSEA
jgi:hypothetical protein